MVSRFSVLARISVVLALAACSNSHRDRPCPRNQPAFHLELTAADGVLPDDTQLTVGYEGILKEHYSLAKGGRDNVDLCCAPGDVIKGPLPNVPCAAAHVGETPMPDASRGVGAPVPDASVVRLLDAGDTVDAAVRPRGSTAIHCSIWTDNVADIQVTAMGYAPYHRPFEADVPDPRCGVETIDAHITLYRPEAGM